MATPAFDKYVEDFTSARSDALKAIEAFGRCTNASTSRCDLRACSCVCIE